MRRLILLSSLLLLSTVWIVAQSQSTSGYDTNQQSSGTSVAPQNQENYPQGTSQMNAPAEENNAQGTSQMNAPANAPSGSEEGMTQNESSGGKTVEGNQGGQETGTSSNVSGSERSAESNQAYGENSPSSSMHQGTTSRVRTVTGCVSEENGQFMLTDKSGNTFQLTGKTSQLKAHVGHEIRVKGRESTSESAMMHGNQPGMMHGNQPGSMSGGQGAEQSLSVISFKHISSTCTANPAR